jgi:hypothetical protein
MCVRLAAALMTSALLFLVVPAAGAQDRRRVDFENGAAITGYNDVRIPGDTGTMFSLTDDLASDTTYFWRLRADVRIAPKHVLSALAAPLTINSAGSFDQPVSFAGATFAPGVPVKGPIEGDALAAPQGRAEDIFAGLVVHAVKQWSIKAGYRFLEGGADNGEVCTSALVHYLAAGMVVRF